MKRWITGLGLALAGSTGYAQVPPILLEACNAMEPANKRMECLRAANQSSGVANGSSSSDSVPQSAYSAPTSTAARARPSTGSGGATCHVGPRGGTYTITASGRKNYAGC